MTQRLYTPATDADIPAVAGLLHHAFAGPRDKCEEVIKAAGVSQLRVIRPAPGAAPSACLWRIAMAQYFGGRSVRMDGIAGVAVAPGERGVGLGREIMRACVREMAAQGVPISTLYPATQTLYRQVGYEQAGYRCEITIPIDALQGGRRELAVRPLTDADAGLIRACYGPWAAAYDGMVDRGDYIWSRIRRNRDHEYEPFGAFNAGGGLEGYLFLNQTRKPETGRFDAALSDIAWATPAAGQTLLRFLADLGTMGENLTLFGGPGHPLIMLMDGVRYQVRRKDYWMTRILRVKEALEARGYAASTRATVCFEIEDDLVAENTGGWTLRVEAGLGRVERGTTGETLRLHARALAALYCGWVTPRQAAAVGWVQGSPAALHAAEGVFNAGTPWMSDMF